jgi:MtaA/CmuA family methyltransferase
MGFLTAEGIARLGTPLREAHTDAGKMATLALDIARLSGFEAVGIPLCATVEMEMLGCEVELGNSQMEPGTLREPFTSVREVTLPPLASVLHEKRALVLYEAIRRLRESASDLPVIANIAGPVSLAAGLVDPMKLIVELRTKRAETHRLLEKITQFLIEFALELIKSGAEVITIHEDTGGSKIIGPKLFEEYTAVYVNRIIDALRTAGVPTIVHICSELEAERSPRGTIQASIHSAETTAELRGLKERYPDALTMGGLSPFLLHHGPAERIARVAWQIARDGEVDIIAPGCGLGLSTPLAHVQAMTQAVAEFAATEV